MSKCPQNDIHSLYIDNELPNSYRIAYEKHIATCEHCKKKHEAYKALRSNLTMMNDTITTCGNYEKLKDELRFKTTVSKSNGLFFNFSKKYSHAMVAAAVLVVFFPVFSYVSKVNNNKSQFSNAFASNNPLIDDLAVQVALSNQNTVRLKKAVQNVDVLSGGNFYNASYTNSLINYEKDFNIQQKQSSLPVEVILYVTPSTVINSVDSFGLERPVFLYQD